MQWTDLLMKHFGVNNFMSNTLRGYIHRSLHLILLKTTRCK
jgi:hypothetical protein